jgi:hypothetical protein
MFAGGFLICTTFCYLVIRNQLEPPSIGEGICFLKFAVYRYVVLHVKINKLYNCNKFFHRL